MFIVTTADRMLTTLLDVVQNQISRMYAYLLNIYIFPVPIIFYALGSFELLFIRFVITIVSSLFCTSNIQIEWSRDQFHKKEQGLP